LSLESSPLSVPEPDGVARRAWLIRTLTGLSRDFTGEIGDETALAEGGLGLDSIALIELIGALHERLGVIVPEHEITSEHFGSVSLLLRFLESRLGQRAHEEGAREANSGA
jgi:acyl carrier protein